MSKAFTKESDNDDDDDLPEGASPIPKGSPNYVTPQGFAALQEELRFLVREERPKVVEVVSWAAGNGDRSENGDYLYGKKRLRQIDSRIRFLNKRMEAAKIVDPKLQTNRDQVFFGATVTYENSKGEQRTVTIVGIDEADLTQGKVSWVAPIARALMKAYEGDEITFRAPSGPETLEIVEIKYPD